MRPLFLQKLSGGPDPQANSVNQIGVAPSLLGDARVASLLMADGRQRVVTRVFGVPREDQSFLVTVILTGAVVTVLRGLVPRPWPRPSGSDAAIGGSVFNATFGGIAGAPARSMPLAGALIGFALLSHSIRPALAGSAREVRALAREARAALRAFVPR